MELPKSAEHKVEHTVLQSIFRVFVLGVVVVALGRYLPPARKYPNSRPLRAP